MPITECPNLYILYFNYFYNLKDSLALVPWLPSYFWILVVCSKKNFLKVVLLHSCKKKISFKDYIKILLHNYQSWKDNYLNKIIFKCNKGIAIARLTPKYLWSGSNRTKMKNGLLSLLFCDSWISLEKKT